MQVDAFDFDLPESLIALRPAEPRESARLLCIEKGGRLTDRHIGDLPELLAPRSVLVVNDTRVLPTQLYGRRFRDRQAPLSIESTLIKMRTEAQWEAFIKPGRRVKVGDILHFGFESKPELKAQIIEKYDDGRCLLTFSTQGQPLMEALHKIGHMPIPPYIRRHRREDVRDETDYQTIFAQKEGSVAAPTAGLHFTPPLLDRLKAANIAVETVTLHVGAGTFLPVKVEDTDDHVMHAEFGVVNAETAERLNQARQEGRAIVCVGTTSLRVLETCCKGSGIYTPYADYTNIFLTPGVKIHACDQLLTNFHLPKSTLFMLVSAVCGLDIMKAAYRHAIAQAYRFYSYGDACLLSNFSHITD